MEQWFSLFIEHLADRLTGPMNLRIYMQPAMATFFAVRAGLHDAGAGKAPYFWSLLSDPGHRAEMVKDGWKSIGKVFVIAMVLDLAYQKIVLKSFYPLEMVVVAFFLAIVPYVLIRGPVTRIARRG